MQEIKFKNNTEGNRKLSLFG